MSRRLIIEVDGASHVGRDRADARRDRELEQLGYRVLHIEARDVIGDTAGVIAKIREALGSG